MNWALKYRPRSWDDIIGQESALATLCSTLQKEHIARAYLLEGERGIGKTSLAYVYAHALMCLNRQGANPCGKCRSCKTALADHPDFTILDSASLGGINDIRERILGSMHYEPILGAYRVYIIDEAHGLSAAAANALLATIEDAPAKTVFFFCTTQPERMIDTLRDRCWRIHLQAGSPDLVRQQLERVAKAEHLDDIDPEILTLLAEHSGGSYRQATIGLENMVHTFGKDIDLESVRSHLGLPPDKAVQGWLDRTQAGDWDGSLGMLRNLRGFSPQQTLRLILKMIPIDPDRPESLQIYSAMTELIMQATRRLRAGIEAGIVLQLLTLESIDLFKIKQDQS